MDALVHVVMKNGADADIIGESQILVRPFIQEDRI